MRNSEGPLPALVAGAVVVCIIATVLGFAEIWIPVIAAFVVVGSMCHKN